MKKKRLPKMNCKIGKNVDGYEFGCYRDQIGNIRFLLWKCGVGFKDNEFMVLADHHNIKKLRDYLNKIIAYTERE